MANARALIAVTVLVSATGSAVEVRYDVAGRWDLRVRTPLPGDRAGGITSDMELVPSALGELRWKTTALALQYHPTVLLREPQLAGPVLGLHRGRATLTQRLSRSTLALAQHVTYGQADVGSLRNPEGAMATALPEVQTLGALLYLRAASSLSLDAPVSTRLMFSLSGAYVVSGGPDPASSMPLQWGPLARGQVRWATSRRTWLSAEAQASHTSFVTGQRQLVTQLFASWDHQLSRTTALTLSGGAALTNERAFASGEGFDLLPVAGGRVAQVIPIPEQRVTLGASVRLAPFVDRFTGNVYERLEARAEGQWSAFRASMLAAACGAAWAVPIGDRTVQAGDRLVFGELGFFFVSNRWLAVGLTARVLWSEQPRLGIPGQVQWVSAVSITAQQSDSAVP